MTSTSLCVSALVVLAAVVSDVATRRIPHVITLGGLASGLAIHAAAGAVSAGFGGALRGLGLALLGAALCSILPVLSWRRGEMGGGDVKLFAALGALLGPTLGFDVQAKTFALAFLILFPYRLVRHGALRAALANVVIGLRNAVRAKAARVPYVESVKLPPVVLAPTIGVAFAISMVLSGALR